MLVNQELNNLKLCPQQGPQGCLPRLALCTRGANCFRTPCPSGLLHPWASAAPPSTLSPLCLAVLTPPSSSVFICITPGQGPRRWRTAPALPATSLHRGPAPWFGAWGLPWLGAEAQAPCGQWPPSAWPCAISTRASVHGPPVLSGNPSRRKSGAKGQITRPLGCPHPSLSSPLFSHL